MDKIAETAKREKVYIVGFAPSWIETPWQDQDAEIWGLNELYQYIKKTPGARADRWFEIHNPQSPSKSNPQHQEWLKQCPIPLYMWKHFDEYPASIPYPREEVKAMFNENFIFPGNPIIKAINDLERQVYDKGAKFSNFSNQITWMVGLAIYEGFKEIHVYGVDMATKEEIRTADGTQSVTGEYIWQRPSVEAAVMFATGRGIKVLIPQTSELCKFAADYGFETDNQVRCYLRSRKKNMLKKDNQFAQQEQQLLAQLEGVKQNRISIRATIAELSYLLGNHIV